MLRTKAIQEWVEVCKANTLKSQISGTWRLVFVFSLVIVDAVVWFCRDIGNEGINFELLRTQRRSLRICEEGPKK